MSLAESAGVNSAYELLQLTRSYSLPIIALEVITDYEVEIETAFRSSWS